jgi:hypothetical protein
MKTETALTLFFVTAIILRAQEPNKLFAYWNASPSGIPVRATERTASEISPEKGAASVVLPEGGGASVVLLRDASQFELHGVTRLPHGSRNEDGSMTFFIFINDRMVFVTFTPLYKSDGKPYGGNFELIAKACGGPNYQFVRDSDAEKVLLDFMRWAFAALLDAGVKPVNTAGPLNVSAETAASLAALFEHYPSDQPKSGAEQPGAGQPATKPADKVSPKDQPSTPTSKDAPR